MYFEAASSPDSPATGADTSAESPFSGVPEALLPALQGRGFEQLTTVQRALLDADDGSSDLRISSQTGSGKTVALGFALCRGLDDPERQGPTTLVIAPVRELAAQVAEELGWLFADLDGVVCDVVTGGSSISRERMRLKKRPAVLVGTPGRLLDHIRERALDLSSVRQLVLDEADQMLDLGFKDELDGILEALPEQRRTHLVSATFPRAVIDLADRFQKDPILVQGQAPGTAHADIEHIALKIHAREHYAALVNILLLAGHERTLVFVRTREDTTTLADKLAADGFAALPISGDLAQAQRTRTLAAFKRGAVRTLIATDVAARGLDISDVTTVVHIDPPVDAATYTHRSGRTGRAGQKGRSIMLVLKSQETKARRLHSYAKVTAHWTTPPDQAAVELRQMQRAEQRALEAVAAHSFAEAPCALARELLTGRDPVEVVAALLQQASKGPREPFPFAAVPGSTPALPPRRAVAAPAAPAKPAVAAKHAVAAKSAAAAKQKPVVADAEVEVPSAVEAEAVAAPARETADEPAPTPESKPRRTIAPAARARAGAPPAWRREAVPPSGEIGFTRFRINWGRSAGAEPRRILAHVCRRGDIDSRAVGSIEMHATMSTFDVANDVAAAFARRVQRRDRRDPDLVITRVFHAPKKPRAHRDEAEAASE